MNESKYLQNLLGDIGFHDIHYHPAQMFCDSSGATSLAHNPYYHSRTKHIDVKQHYIRECIANRQIVLKHIPGIYNPADGFTKPLDTTLFRDFVSGLKRDKNVGNFQN